MKYILIIVLIQLSACSFFVPSTIIIHNESKENICVTANEVDSTIKIEGEEHGILHLYPGSYTITIEREKSNAPHNSTLEVGYMQDVEITYSFNKN